MNRAFTRSPAHLAAGGVVALTLVGAELPTLAQGAKVKDPNWKAPRTSWGHPDDRIKVDDPATDAAPMEVRSGAQVEGRQPIRELGFGK